MSSIKKNIDITPLDSFIGVIVYAFRNRSIKFIKHGLMMRKHNRAAKPLMDINVLNERIGYIKNLAKPDGAPEKFYVMIRHSPTAGLFSAVHAMMSQIIYALAKGMIPVVDMQNYQNPYLEEGELGIVNAWEKYFKQPCGYSLDDIAGKKQVQSYGAYWQQLLPSFIFSGQEQFGKYLKLWAAIYDNFFILNDKCAQYIEQEYKRLIKPGMRVLGVKYRGTDFSWSRPLNHPIQPPVDAVIDKVKEVISDWDCDYIFVGADERKTLTQFENAFPGKVLSVSRKYYDESDCTYESGYTGPPSTAGFDRENDVFLCGLEYLSSVIIFSRCTSAIMGAASGSMAALYINGGRFENTYIFNLGVY